MRNNTCVVCLKEFAPREGKLYCSNACKQKGYSDKKNQVGEHDEKEQAIKAISKQLQFHYPEFEEYRNKYPNGISNFIVYCFFRKNLTGVTNIEQIHNYIESFDGNWWEEFWDFNSPARKKYLEFEAKYLGDEVIISFSEQVKNSA